MTNNEINAAIAECCGWKHCKWSDVGLIGVHPLNQKFSDSEHAYWRIPNYRTDLNAMHEAEVRLEDEMATCHQYWKELAEITMADDEEEATVTRYRRIGNATARQRAEAFLRTIGKWRDE